MSVYTQMIEEWEEKISTLTAELDRLAKREAKWQSGLNAATEMLVKVSAERDQLHAALKAVEFCHGGGKCPTCARYREHGHAPDCIVGLALEARA